MKAATNVHLLAGLSALFALVFSGCNRQSEQAEKLDSPPVRETATDKAEARVRPDPQTPIGVENLANRPAEKALAFIPTLKSERDRIKALDLVISSHGEDHSEEIARLIRELVSEPEQTTLLRKLACMCAAQNPGLFDEQFDGTTPSNERTTMMRAAFRLMGGKELAAFLIRVEHQGFPEDIQTLSDLLKSGQPNTNSTRDLVGVLSDLKSQKLRESVAYFSGLTSSQAAITPFEQMTASVSAELKVSFAQGMIACHLSKSPDEFRKIFSDPTLPSEVSSPFIQRQVSVAMGLGMSAALKEAESMPEPIFDRYWAELGRQWVNRDSLVASKMAPRIENPRARDILTEEISIFCMSNRDLEQAKSWAESISDPTRRASLLTKLGK